MAKAKQPKPYSMDEIAKAYDAGEVLSCTAWQKAITKDNHEDTVSYCKKVEKKFEKLITLGKKHGPERVELAFIAASLRFREVCKAIKATGYNFAALMRVKKDLELCVYGEDETLVVEPKKQSKLKPKAPSTESRKVDDNSLLRGDYSQPSSKSKSAR